MKETKMETYASYNVRTNIRDKVYHSLLDKIDILTLLGCCDVFAEQFESYQNIQEYIMTDVDLNKYYYSKDIMG